MVEESSKEVKEASGGINDAFGLWNGRGKVAFSGRAKDTITIPQGAKILVFKNKTATDENRRPVYNVCFALDE